jgi:hypothetical protein
VAINKRNILLTATRLEYYKNANIDITCCKCRKTPVLNETIIASAGRSKSNIKTKYYHKICWEKLFQ